MNFQSIQLVLLDSDGVLTDGGVYIDDQGHEFRRFSIKDGAGIKKLQKAGIPVAVISSSSATPVSFRASRLSIPPEDCRIGVKNKVAAAQDILDRHGVRWSDAAFIGDDLADLKLLSQVGFPIAVADAVEAVKAKASYITHAAGGHGAVREIADLIVPEDIDVGAL